MYKLGCILEAHSFLEQNHKNVFQTLERVKIKEKKRK